MNLPFRHPPFSRLRAFALGECGEAARRRVARHLERCARCREEVSRVRAIAAAARAREVPPAGALERVLARRARGERVVLPAAAPAGAGRARWVPRAAAIAVVLAGALYVLGRTGELEAERSELHLVPAAPRMGEPIRVEYRATSRLADEPRLVLRARFRTPETAPQEERYAVLGLLERTGDGTFAGTVRLPDSTVYAVLAVEDTLARFVDHHGERWEVLVHGADGRPLFDALYQRSSDVELRDTRLATETAEELTRLYPGRPDGWQRLLYEATSRAPRAAADSIRAEHRARYLPLVARSIEQADSPDVGLLASAVFYAEAANDTAAAARWKALLYERYPRHQATLQRRVFDLYEEYRSRPAELPGALERMYQEVGASGQLAFSAFNLAVQWGDGDAAARWAPRLIEAAPWWMWWMKARVARSLARFAAHRRLAAQYLRSEIESYAAVLEQAAAAVHAGPTPNVFQRPLTQTAAEYSEALQLRLGELLTLHGTTLLELGDTAAALDTLSRAFDAGWDPERLRTIGELHLARGDTAAAARAFARVVVDPTTSAAADSLRARLGAAGSGPAWEALLSDARAVMKQYVWDGAVDRAPLLPRLRLKDVDGRARVVELRQGTPMLVAFWSRYCPASFAQLDELARVASRLEAEGVPVVTLSTEGPATLRQFMEGKGYRFPVFIDAERDAAAAFDTPALPTYFVLDDAGRIRFAHHDVSRVIRQVAALREAK
ncbi:MAG TPA: redoxin domain-containing protein [Longimicrobiales bacterium]